MTALSHLRRIRWAVRLTLTLGVAASVAANILHADPNPISQTISAWPPLALLLTVELISRIPVNRAWLAIFRIIATIVIAAIAAWVSYWHMAGVAARYGETGASPYLLPLSVDGLIVVASISLVELAARIRDLETPPRHIPEVLAPATPATVPAPSTPDTAPATVRPAATKTTAGTTRAPAKKTTSKRTPAKKTSTPTPAPEPAAHPAPQTPAPAATGTASEAPNQISGLLPVARLVAASHQQATGQTITPGQLAVRLRIGTPTAERILDHLATIDRPATADPHNGTPITAGVPA